MTLPSLRDPLPTDILALRRTLPLKPAPVTLIGRRVRLEPLDLARDLDTLFAISDGRPFALGDRTHNAYDAEAQVWRFMAGGPFATVAAMDAYFQGQLNAANGLPFTVFDSASGHAVGVANFMSNVPDHLKIELGSIWYSPIAQRTGANTEATYLMVRHAFALGYQRVEWKCNALNTPSREAALKLGFQFEGIQEDHMIIKDRPRDTAWFRILAREWGTVAAALEKRLYDRA